MTTRALGREYPGTVTVALLDGEPYIQRADDLILVAVELVEQAQAGENRAITVDGDVLTLTAKNGTLRYRLGEVSANVYPARQIESTWSGVPG